MSRITTVRRALFLNLLLFISAALLLQGCGKKGHTPPPPATVVSYFAYAANNGSDSLSAYSINATTGVLTPIDADAGTPGVQNFATGDGPIPVSVTPSGKFVYVGNDNIGSISAYSVDSSSGALTPIDADAGTPGIQDFRAAGGPDAITIDPMGKFVYVANNISNNVSAYTIDASTGFLTSIDADPVTAGIQDFTAGTNPYSIAIDPTGKFVYVANDTSGDVSAYLVDTTTGFLTQIDADTTTSGIQNFTAGTNPNSVTVDPTGRFAYVANFNSNGVSAFLINTTTGFLTPIDADVVTPGVQTFASGAGADAVSVDPTGKFAYVANYSDNNVSAFLIDATTGFLTQIDADPVTPGFQNFSTGTTPHSITIDPAGKFVYVANYASNNISAYLIDTVTGFLTPIDADPLTAGNQNFAAGINPRSITTTRTIH